MKGWNWLLLAGVVGMCAWTAPAVEVELSGEAEVKAASVYLWRGHVLNDEPVIQPSLTLTAEGVSFNVWGTWDMQRDDDSSARERVDLTLDYRHISGEHLLAGGAVAYIYHDDPGGRAKDTFELFLGYTLDAVSLPSLTVYYDFGKIEGLYAVFSLSHSIPLVEDVLDLDLRTTVGAGDESYLAETFAIEGDPVTGRPAFEPEDAALLDWQAIVSLPVTLGEHVELVPEARYMMLLNSAIKDAVNAAGEDSDEFAFSLTVRGYF